MLNKAGLFRVAVVAGFLCMAVVIRGGQDARAANEALWAAAQAGDTARLTAALAQGAAIDARARYGVTALIFAAGGGHLGAVQLLVNRGADVNAVDTFYNGTAADMALGNGFGEVALFLVEQGAAADSLLETGVQENREPFVRAALAGRVSAEALRSAAALATRLERPAFATLITERLERLPPAAPFRIDPAALPRYAGGYRSVDSSAIWTMVVEGSGLVLQTPDQRQVRLVANAPDVFRSPDGAVTVTVMQRGGPIEGILVAEGPATHMLAPLEPAAVAGASAAATSPSGANAIGTADARPQPAGRAAAARNWPAFRGDGAAGNGDGQRAVVDWDVTSGRNIRWSTAIPGVATSSPIIWGDQVFATTAVSSAGDDSVKTGLYGDVKPLDDLSRHEWKIYSLDRQTGRIRWERTAATGAPRTKRHPKSSQAGSTPVTDGRRVVALFGAAGVMVAWDMGGRELWRVTLDGLDSGWFFDPTFQWGHSSSPIIYRDTVIVQADVQKGSYLAAWDLATGAPRWKTARADEISTWGTPAIVRTGDGRDELVTNGTRVRGYDPATGAVRWTLGPNSEITIGTPVGGHGLVFVTGGYPPVRPIYAIRPGASGDISLAPDTTANAAIAWSNMNEGTYIPTPLVYDGRLFTLNVNGVVNAYDAPTGARAFRGRVGSGGAFSASPVAADGRLYVSSEDGEVFVVEAAPGLRQLAKNDMKAVIMATPAIADGLIVIRTMGKIYGIGEPPAR